MLVGAHYQPHLLVAQVIFVTAGTSHGFPIRRAAVESVESEDLSVEGLSLV